MQRATYLAYLATDVDAFAAAVQHGPLDAPVPWCGAWTLADLAVHLGAVHRWALHAVRHGRPPDERDPGAPADQDALAAWVRAGGAELGSALAAADDDAETWHPFPIPKRVAVWARRQAHETSIHRWDAQQATGGVPMISRVLAADGIDEYFALALPRLVLREGLTLPSGALSVRITDTADRWLVTARGNELVIADEHEALDVTAEMTGRAQDVLLRLWGRPVEPEKLIMSGDPGEWLTLGGM